MDVLKLEEALGKGYKKVYFTFDCIGDTILLMSALKYLYIRNKQKILIGTLYSELVVGCDYLDVLDGFCEENLYTESYHHVIHAGITPVFISSTGFVKENNRLRPVWGNNHIMVNVCGKIGIESKIKVVPDFYLSEKEKNEGRYFEDTQIAIISSGNQPYKSIPFDVSKHIVESLNHKYHFVQIGSIEDPLIPEVLDKRSIGGLRKTASVLYNSDLFIGGIGGLMHVARAVNCRSVIAFSMAEPLKLENYPCNINIFVDNPTCNLCGTNKAFPYLVNCTHDYSCIRGIDYQKMIAAIETQLSKKGLPLEVDYQYSTKDQMVYGIEDYLKRFGQIKEQTWYQ